METSIQQFNHKREREILLPNGKMKVWLEDSGSKVNYITQYPNGSGTSYWARCNVDGCLGEARINGKCLSHSRQEEIVAYIEEIKLSRNPYLSLKGNIVDQSLLNLLLSQLVESDNSINVMLDFTGADIDAQIELNGHKINVINFSGAILHQYLRISNCNVTGQIVCLHTFFNAAPPNFNNVKFEGTVYMAYSHITRTSIGFSNCLFNDSLDLNGFYGESGGLLFDNCGFKKGLQVANSKAAIFQVNDSSVQGTLDLAGSEFAMCRMQNVTLTNTYKIGPLASENDVSITHSQIKNNVTIGVRSKNFDLSGTQFLMGGNITAQSDLINLSQVVPESPLFITGVENTRKPIIASLQGAYVGKMVFSNVDMSCCLFYGAQDLENIVIEPSVEFAKFPNSFDRKRRIIADEIVWRKGSKSLLSKNYSKLWQSLMSKISQVNQLGEINFSEKMEPDKVATTYREIRHSFEVKKDLANAMDFYYGEMDARRNSKYNSKTEKIILTFYWVVSGYGIYASNALLLLFIIILIGSLIFHFFGFPTSNSYIYSLIVSFRSAIPGLQTKTDFTISGEIVEIFLAIVGPVLATFAVLAIREHIKK